MAAISLFPDGEYVPLTTQPGPVVLAPAAALARARRALHRLLRPRAAREHPRHDQRGLRPHGEGEGPVAAADPRQARAPRLADPDRDAVRARLRRGARRRGDPRPRRSSTCTASASTRRQSINNFDLPPIMGVTLYGAFVHRRLQRCSSTSLRVPRPADPADADGRDASSRSTTSRSISRPRTGSCGPSTGLVRARARQGARDRRRVGLGQERDRDDADGAHARRERALRGRGPLQGEGPAPGLGPRHAELPRQRARDDLPGPDDLAEPRLPDRRADRRGDPAPTRTSTSATARSRTVELLRAGRHPEPGDARRRLPAPVLGRDAAARDDRDGAVVQPRRCSSPTSRRRRST